MRNSALAGMPEHLRKPSLVNVFNLRNLPGQIKSYSEKEVYLQSRDLFCLGNPHAFIEFLVDLEEKTGTVFASLVGLMLVSGSSSKKDLEYGTYCFQGLSTLYEGIGHILPNPQQSQREIDSFLLMSGKSIVYCDDNHSFSKGLLNTWQNVIEGAPKHGTGDCIVCAGIIALLFMSKGYIAGEGRHVSSFHDFAFVEHDGVEFFQYEMTFDGRAKKPLPILNSLYGNSLAFIATLAAYRADKIINMNTHSTRSDIIEALELARISELINPYSIPLYGIFKNIYGKLDKPLMAQAAAEYWQALSNWCYSVDYPKLYE